MTETIAVLVMLNNYVHDVATGLLLISALWLGWSAGDLGESPSAEAVDVFKRGYRRCTWFLWGSLSVIIVTGAIRMATFMRFEWQPALGKGLVPVLVLKHLLFFALLGAGAFAWMRIRRRVRSLPGWAAGVDTKQ